MTKHRCDRDDFLPTTRSDMERRGWDELDFLLVTGDAYVDHPSFGHAIVSRWLEHLGFRVGIVAQPRWDRADDFARLGRPRLGALVTAGNLDSMVSHYTAAKKKRAGDDYSPGGAPGLRPDRATLVYCNRLRELWKDVPLVIGGVEASLRRLAHYDYWSDSVRRSILADSRADLLVFGMGERAIGEIAYRLRDGVNVNDIRDIAGTCWKTHRPEELRNERTVELPSFDDVKNDKRLFAKAFASFYCEQDPIWGKRLIQDQGAWWVVQNPPAKPLPEEELDAVYELPYTRAWHPDYDERGGVPALEEVRFSLTAHRGCFGECAFCALSSHQGRIVQARSEESLVSEARKLVALPGFKGYLHDVGGPTANFHEPACAKQFREGACRGKSCLFPKPCKNLRATHGRYLALLRRLRRIEGVKKVFVRSGLRYDFIEADAETGGIFLRELCEHHVSGQLKIAPEHASDAALARMRKSGVRKFVEFMRRFYDATRACGKKQFLVPYFMCAHPGTGVDEAIVLARFLKEHSLRPEQVQEFTPTPGTLATCMYYTGMDPFTGASVHVPDVAERKLQRALMQYWLPANRRVVAPFLRQIEKK